MTYTMKAVFWGSRAPTGDISTTVASVDFPQVAANRMDMIIQDASQAACMGRRASCLLQAFPACWLFPQHRPLPAVAFPVCDLLVKVPAPIKPVPTHFMGVLIKRYLPRNFINWYLHKLDHFLLPKAKIPSAKTGHLWLIQT